MRRPKTRPRKHVFICKFCGQEGRSHRRDAKAHKACYDKDYAGRHRRVYIPLDKP